MEMTRGIYQGHKQTQTNLPDPLSAGGGWGIGNWALPANTLSLASTSVFVAIAAWLLHDQRYRALFVLPRELAIATAAVAAGLAWAIVVRCRSRPGRLLPRLCTLLLAMLASLLAAGAALDPAPGTPWLHALIVATIAAVVTMLPRITKCRVDSLLVQAVAPVTLAVVLALIVPSACYVGRTVINEHQGSGTKSPSTGT